MLGGYGEAVGEAFQMRDDLLGIFGSPAVTGKPARQRPAEHKATSVVVAAYHLADGVAAASAARADEPDDLDDDDIAALADTDRRHRRGAMD